MTPETLKSWRRSQRLSRRALGEQLGYCGRSIERWENGETPIPEIVNLALRCVDAETKLANVRAIVTEE